MEPAVAEALATLEGNPDYRILRRLHIPDGFYNGATGLHAVRRGLYIDTETTGKEPQLCDILELALVPFLYEEGGKILGVREDQCMSFLNDPGVPLTDEIRKLTGIEPEDIVGKSLDMDVIRVMLAGCDLVIAHNAGYDRKVLERHVPEFRELRWACSQQDVPWREVFHAPAEKLELLAMYLGGVFYGAHRAMIDCIAGIHVLATIHDSDGKSAFEYLHEACYTESLRIWATGAPFDTKDMLRDRGYRWNDGRDGRPKAWNKVIKPSDLDEENQWLRTRCGAYPRVTEIAAEDRFSVREG
jgi:DNA polymerase-3 subunit epsilon